MKRIWKFAFAAVLTFVTLLANGEDVRPIRLGDINSYSAAPQFGGPYRNGWRLAVDEINALGGINGRPLEVLARDDEGKQDLALRHAQTLLSQEKADVLIGTYFSNIGLAVSAEAARHKKIFIAAEPLTDALIWDRGSRYTFRLRPSTYMQAAMLADEAAKLPGRRWAILAPNYEYGQSAVASFKQLLKARRTDVEFVGEQWPALGKLDAATAVQALLKAKPDAIFNASFGPDLAKFVHEGTRRGLFANAAVVSMLTGEPENLDLLKDETPRGWIVTGYPWEQIETAEHKRFVAAYTEKFDAPPRLGSLVGYTMIMALAEGIRQAGSADSEKLVTTMRGMRFSSPIGPLSFRAIDQQATMGAYVGILDIKDGKGSMRAWRYADGQKYLPPDSYVKSLRPAAAMR